MLNFTERDLSSATRNKTEAAFMLNSESKRSRECVTEDGELEIKNRFNFVTKYILRLKTELRLIFSVE
jgi:hypothetical protein